MRPRKIAEATMWLPGTAPEVAEASYPAAPVANAISPAPHTEKSKSNSAIGKSALEWPMLDDGWLTGVDTPVVKFEANLQAVELASSLRESHRRPTPDDRIVLSRYTGWGGLPLLFEARGGAWHQRFERLRGTLPDSDFESVHASVNNAHYTAPAIARQVWAAGRRLGFKGGRILEPSAGIGHFLGAMPEEIKSASDCHAVEIDAVSAGMLSAHQTTLSNDAFKLRVRSVANSRLAALVLTKPGYAFSEEKRYGEEYVVADLDASESGSWARHFALLDQYESEGGGEIPIPWQFAQALGGSW